MLFRRLKDRLFGGLGTSDVTLGIQQAGISALQQANGYSPFQTVQRPGRNGGRIFEGGPRFRSTGRVKVVFIAAMEHGGELFTGQSALGLESAVSAAQHDLLQITPGDSIGVRGIWSNI